MPAVVFSAVAASILTQPAVPPPVEQLRVDCQHPAYASDYLVCEDRTLREAEIHLASLTSRLDSDSHFADGAFWEESGAWFRRSRLCAFEATHRECLLAAYSNRIGVVAAALASITDSYQLHCDNYWNNSSVRATIQGDGILVIQVTKGIVAVATPSSATDTNWRTYLGYKQSGNSITLWHIDGWQLNCRLEET